MEPEKKSLRVGALVIACAILLRLLSGGAWDQLAGQLTKPRLAAVLLFLETGRVVRLGSASSQTEPVSDVSEQITEQADPPAKAVFAQSDALLVEVNSTSGYDTDLQSMIQQPLSWELTGDAPTVLIVHSHGTESYRYSGEYTETGAYRTLDENYNVVSVGERLAQVLQEGGVQVIHDRTMHDSPSYNNAYSASRQSVESYLSQNSGICMVLDIHRDSRQTDAGEQITSTVTADGEACAQLMLVVGSDAGGLEHPNWSENMALAVKLHAQLEKNVPGICRPIQLRSQRFNQDLSPGALLVEVGTAANTRQEALAAAEQLAKSILQLAHGTSQEIPPG